MPSKPARACVLGCDYDANTCPEHGPKAKARQYDRWRGTASSRGYGDRWSRYRQWYLNELMRQGVPGLCGSRLPGAPLTTDSACAMQGLISLGVVVDHIIPVSGPTDPTFYKPEAHQLLCQTCHQAKRQRESRQ